MRVGGWILVVALALLSSCRADSAPEPTREPAPSSAPRANAHQPSESGARAAEAGSPVDTPQIHSSLSPPPVAPGDAHVCERDCGDLHSCLLVLDWQPAAAASVEFGCVEGCLTLPHETAAFGCPRPSDFARPSCEHYVGCVDEAWGRAPVEVLTTPDPTDDLGHGCEKICRVFANCSGLNQVASAGDREATERCIKSCSGALDPEQTRAAEACTELGDCDAIKHCVLAVPGA